MTTLYLCEQGAVLRKSSRRLIVTKDKRVLLDVPIIKIKRVFVFGNIQVTTQTLSLLLEHGVDLSFFTLRGRLRGRLTSIMSKNIFLRLAQYERWQDKDFKIQLCRTIIDAKLKNMKFVMQRFLSNHPEMKFDKYFETINRGLGQLNTKTDVSGLLGVEGASSSSYFASFRLMFKRDLQFKKRVMHPSHDPVNALLNLGYVMITNEIASCLDGMSFDPFLGFLHGIKYGRKSLALDLVEEFRQPLIDTFILKLANLRIFNENDFKIVPGEGVHLTDNKFKEYLGHYEKRLNEQMPSGPYSEMSWRDLFKHQCKQLEKAILEGKEYQPFIAGRKKV